MLVGGVALLYLDGVDPLDGHQAAPEIVSVIALAAAV